MHIYMKTLGYIYKNPLNILNYGVSELLSVATYIYVHSDKYGNIHSYNNTIANNRGHVATQSPEAILPSLIIVSDIIVIGSLYIVIKR